MTRTVRVRPRANRDIDEALEYLEQEAPHAALRLLDSLSSAFSTLAQFPEVGTSCTFRHALLQHTRMWRVPGSEDYIVFYSAAPDAIDIIRVLHGARDIDRLADWPAR